MAVQGTVTFDQVDSDQEVNLGGSYTDFEFMASGEIDSPSGVIRRSQGSWIDDWQWCEIVSSNGSNHRNYCVQDRVIKVMEYVSNSWVTTLEVEFIAPTSTGIRVNVITANIDIPVLIKAR